MSALILDGWKPPLETYHNRLTEKQITAIGSENGIVVHSNLKEKEVALVAIDRLPKGWLPKEDGMTAITYEQITTEHGLKDMQCIGDGVYAGNDGYQMWLIKEREDRWDTIALDGTAYCNLVDHVRKWTEKRRDEATA